MATATAKMADITINETICFIFSHYSSVANENIFVVISSFYTEEELVRVKTLIPDVCEKSLGDGANVPRIGSASKFLIMLYP